ncbi:MAG: hypothetical protein LUH07_08705, partial [Lachnospiraceae bacterium]|nr:hypothetical protein [Lachnospiraceae bacterium]
MKKNRKKAILLSILILAAAVIAVVAVMLFIRYRNKSTYIQQQNYVASKLLELGDYEEGRQLAAQSEQSSPNETSEALLVLAIAFQEDYDTALRYLSLFEDDAADSILIEIQEKISAYQEAVTVLSASDEDENNDGNGTNAEDLEELESNLHSDLLIILL